jgi:hypothetical protein
MTNGLSILQTRLQTRLNNNMPKDVRKLIISLEDTLTKLEYALDSYDTDTEPCITLGQLIDELVEINDELDSQVEE